MRRRIRDLVNKIITGMDSKHEPLSEEDVLDLIGQFFLDSFVRIAKILERKSASICL